MHDQIILDYFSHLEVKLSSIGLPPGLFRESDVLKSRETLS